MEQEIPVTYDAFPKYYSDVAQMDDLDNVRAQETETDKEEGRERKSKREKREREKASRHDAVVLPLFL